MTDFQKFLNKNNNIYVKILLPLALPKVYEYGISSTLRSQIKFGKRVEVALRRKLYSGLIVGIREGEAPDYPVKDIVSILDDHPIIDEQQYSLWEWISNYYCCTVGEVMGIALPSGLKLSSETKIILNADNEVAFEELDGLEYILAEALEIRNEIPIYDVQEILQKKTIYPTIRSLIEKGVAIIKEELKEKYKVKRVPYLSFTENYVSDESKHLAMDLVARSEKQTRALLAMMAHAKGKESVSRKLILDSADVSSAVTKRLIEKGICKQEEVEESRLKSKQDVDLEDIQLSGQQKEALSQILERFQEKKPVLLHGVTGSGKTLLYIELISKTIEQGGQVLYLLPEIGLTTQITSRIEDVFGSKMQVYHSRINNNDRVEIWKKTKEGLPIVLGARSSLFLPFQNLQLIIVDEEHDPSFKQSDPAPRYHARDTAIFLAHKCGANIILGSATPALESVQNAIEGKYNKVELSNRYGGLELPEVQLVNLSKAYAQNRMQGMFSKDLLVEMQQVLDRKEQILIFQNRRGYSPVFKCDLCDWYSECTNCDVKLTVHNRFNELRCHYCGKRETLPAACPRCGSTKLSKLGFGTEKIEDEIMRLIPDAKVKRLDYDTAKTKAAFQRILHDFDSGKVQILVGTQMITKGLDFDNIALVGILNADKTINFPDFRANERAFQLFTQVSGRAGRKKKKAKVIIQTFSPTHPVILETIDNNFERFFARESIERKKFLYPPFFKIIYIHLKHKKAEIVRDAAQFLAEQLKKELGNRVLGPTEPGIARIRGLYQRVITIKIEKKSQSIFLVKDVIHKKRQWILDTKGFKSVRINVDVDPY